MSDAAKADRLVCIDELRSEVRAGFRDGGSLQILETLLSIEAILLRMEARDLAKATKRETAKADRDHVAAASKRTRGRKKPVPTLKLS